MKNHIGEILDAFLRDMESSNKSRNTIVNYRSDLKSFMNHCPKDIENLNVEILRKHLDGLNCKSPTTRARHICSLKKFLNWCYKKDFISDNPLLKIEQKKQTPLPAPRKIERTEIDKVLCSINIFNNQNQIRKNNLKYRLIFTLMLEAGLKVNEALNLEYENVEVETQTIFVNSLGEKRRIPLFSAESIKLFRLYTDKMNIKSGLIFKGGDSRESLSYQALNKFWRKQCQKTGVDIKLQQLRDCFANELVKKGINICVISKMLGHKNLQTTVKYLQ